MGSPGGGRRRSNSNRTKTALQTHISKDVPNDCRTAMTQKNKMFYALLFTDVSFLRRFRPSIVLHLAFRDV